MQRCASTPNSVVAFTRPGAPRQYPRIYCFADPGSGKSNPRSRLDDQSQTAIALPAEINLIGAPTLAGRVLPLIQQAKPLSTVSGHSDQPLKTSNGPRIGKILSLLSQWSRRTPAEACRLLYFPSMSTARDLFFRLRTPALATCLSFHMFSYFSQCPGRALRICALLSDNLPSPTKLSW